LKILSTASSIADSGFENIDTLNTLVLYEGVEVIGNSAFDDCDKFSSYITINLPSSLTTIGNYAFYSTGGQYSSPYYIDFTKAKNITSIGESAFQQGGLIGDIDMSNCNNLSSANSGFGAFMSTGITSIKFPNHSGFTAVPRRFCHSTLITSVIFTQYINSVESYAFNSCKKLSDVSSFEYITSIGEQAFETCTSLDDDDLTFKKVVTIGESAFRYCSLIENIYLPETVTSVGNYAFLGTNVTRVYLGHEWSSDITLTKDTHIPSGTIVYSNIPRDNYWEFSRGKDVESISVDINGGDATPLVIQKGLSTYNTYYSGVTVSDTDYGRLFWAGNYLSRSGTCGLFTDRNSFFNIYCSE